MYDYSRGKYSSKCLIFLYLKSRAASSNLCILFALLQDSFHSSRIFIVVDGITGDGGDGGKIAITGGGRVTLSITGGSGSPVAPGACRCQSCLSGR